MRHTRKQRAGSGVGQVIPRGGEAEAREGGRGKRRWRILPATLSPILILLDPRDAEQGTGVSSAFLPFSLSSALAMAEAGAGLSETVTETTVTVTTEPVRKAAEGGGAVLFRGLGDTVGEGIELWSCRRGWAWGCGRSGVESMGLGESRVLGLFGVQRWCGRTVKRHVRI